MIKAAPAVLLVAALVTGCGGGKEEPPTRVAQDFAAAVASKNGAAACALLAPKTRQEVESSTSHPCAEGILEEEVPTSRATRRTDTYGRQARVVTEEDTLFLSRFSLGWRVVAAACEDEGIDQPYDCDVQGG
jgi:hypothetical protein